VADFFPSIDRNRAKQALVQRTSAHESLVELIFYCLETWLPRFKYLAMTGLPIEPNDVSRLIAHNYLKSVDAEFPDSEGCRYVRYVDDCTIFVPDQEEANEVKLKHHMSLRGLGLNPNAAKSEIMSVEEYQKTRHRDVNLQIDRLDKSRDEKGFNSLVAKWYRSRKTKEKWDRVTKRLYRTARNRGWACMKKRVVKDLQEVPQLTESAIEYLLQLETADECLGEIMRLWNRNEANTERLIHLAKYLCEASFSVEGSKQIADFAVGRITQDDDRPGSGYSRGLLLLALNKHGARVDREKVSEWASVEALKDEQLRLHFLYVFACRKELDKSLRLALVPLLSSDIDLLLRICDQAEAGQVRRVQKILNKYVRVRGKHRSVEARVLPLIFALVKSRNDGVRQWLDRILQSGKSKSWLPVRDVVLRTMLEKLREDLMR
jgi:hypothetical protein